MFFLISVSVLQQLLSDRKAMLENNCRTFRGMNCAKVVNLTVGHNSRFKRLMTVRVTHIKGESYEHGLKYHQS